MKYGNLHLHSVYSDSQFTPYQLVLIGKSLGYRALALTDHWSDAGFDEFFGYAKAEGCGGHDQRMDILPIVR